MAFDGRVFCKPEPHAARDLNERARRRDARDVDEAEYGPSDFAVTRVDGWWPGRRARRGPRSSTTEGLGQNTWRWPPGRASPARKARRPHTAAVKWLLEDGEVAGLDSDESTLGAHMGPQDAITADKVAGLHVYFAFASHTAAEEDEAVVVFGAEP